MTDPLHELIGEARSILGAPSEEAWGDLLALVALGIEEDEARAREALVPYLDGALASWPDRLRVIPKPWLVALLYHGETHPALSLGRVLRWDNVLDDEMVEELFDAHDALANITYLGVDLEGWLHGALLAPLTQLTRWGDARFGAGRWFPRLDTLEVMGGWEGVTAPPQAHSHVELADILGEFLRSRQQIRALVLGEGYWRFPKLGRLLHDRQGISLSHLGARDATLVSKGNTTRAMRWPDGHQTPGTPPEVALAYEGVWVETWHLAGPDDEMGPGWRRNDRTEPTLAQRDANRAIQCLANNTHRLLGVTTLSFEGPCTVAHEQRDHELVCNDRIIFFNDGWQDYEPRWE